MNDELDAETIGRIRSLVNEKVPEHLRQQVYEIVVENAQKALSRYLASSLPIDIATRRFNIELEDRVDYWRQVFDSQYKSQERRREREARLAVWMRKPIGEQLFLIHEALTSK